MVINITFSEIELASDLKSFISFNSNSCEDEILKKEILDCEEDELLKVTKSVASPLKIIKVEKVTEELLEKAI